MNSQNDKKNTKEGIDKFLRYSNLAFEMGLVIFVGTFGGVKLDDYFKTEKPWFTVALSLFSVFASLYIVIRRLKNEK